MMFRDRDQAARLLAEKLTEILPKYGENIPLVLGIPRGAVPMALIIAEALSADLDIALVHKFGHPMNPEYALGSVTEEGEVYLGLGAEREGLKEDDIEESARREVQKLQAKRKLYTPHRQPIDVRERLVIVVDDGVATGATITAAVRSLKEKGALQVIVATPVASNDAVRRLTQEGAEVCAVLVPEVFFAVSQFYEDFSEVTDADVVQVLHGRRPEITIHAGPLDLKAFLTVPDHPKGLVIFAHGSGSGRHSPRNQFVARVLQDAGIATLLADLLTEDEVEDRSNVFDIDLLTDRISLITRWVEEDPQLSHLGIGYFGASTGAAAALKAAAEEGDRIASVVSRGGRPDLALEDLDKVTAATLLIVGGDDEPVLTWNKQAFTRLTCQREISIIPGATHLFEEPGALERVSHLAAEWFERHFPEPEMRPGVVAVPESAAGPEPADNRK